MRRVVEEINHSVKGQLKNIYQYTNVDYFLVFTEGSIRISLNPSLSFIALMEKYDTPARMPSSFTMLLRKHIKNAKFLGVEQDGFSRVARFRFEKRNELGDLVAYSLYVETMGKFSNMILVDQNGKIIDVHKRIVTMHRELLPGKKFILYSSSKKDPFEVDITKIKFDNGLRMVLVKNIEGISPLIEHEIYYRAGADTPQNLNTKSLERAWKEFIEEYRKGFTYLLKKHEEPKDISVIKITHLEYENEKMKPSEAIKQLVLFKEKEERFESKRKNLERVVKREIEKLEDIIDKLSKEMRETLKMEDYKKYGELLKAYFYQIPIGSTEAKLYDWQEDKMVLIPLDPRYSPLELSRLYFDKYKKLKRKKEKVEKRLKQIKYELSYLESILQFLNDAESIEDIEEIEKELVDIGLLKKQRKKGSKSEISKPREIRYKNALILIGKNNRQNDLLVRRASPNDLWLHAHEIPGAHVIVKTDSDKIDSELIEYAASLAAGYSRGKNSGKVPVDFTRIKYVKKPRGAKPGFVVYRNYKTIFVEPKRLKD
ncbi:MAG: NFACT family protein [Thermotogaceae bacterium]|nr:NFACT family protein [Thermotogaceae bacterium]